MRALWSVVCALALAAPRAGASPHWTTEHHDIRNSGLADELDGPAEANSTCYDFMVFNASCTYASTGSLSLQNEFLYIGGSDNLLEIIEVETRAQVTVKLNVVKGVAGIVASPSVYYIADVNGTQLEEVVYVGSTDGNVYALNSAQCLGPPLPPTEQASRADLTPMTFADRTGTVPTKTRAPAARVVRDLAPPCVIWSVPLAGPVFGPTHVTDQGVPATHPAGLLFVASTNETHDSDGILYALDAATGATVWQYAAVVPVTNPATGNTTMKSYGLRWAPAIDTGRGVLYIGFGPLFVALDMLTGQVLSSVTGDPTDPFCSSPSLTPDLDNLFVHSALGNVWRIALGLPPPQKQPPTLTLTWKCGYSVVNQAPFANCTTKFTEDAWMFAAALESHGDISASPAEWVVDGDNTHPFLVGERLTLAGVYPYSTPALFADESRIAVSQFSFGPSGEVGGIYVAEVADGSIVWAYADGMPSAAGQYFGYSRSTPAVDGTGNVYVGADVPYGALEIPVLFAFTPTGALQWAVVLGDEDQYVGQISPVVGEGFKNEKRVYMASLDNVVVIEEGCPTSVFGLPCSGNGTCNCATKQCMCNNGCIIGNDCSQPNTCNGNGACNPALTPVCQCTGCYSGPTCNITCSGNGYCVNGLCTCRNPCYHGDQCESECGGQGTCHSGSCVCNNGCYSGPTCATVCSNHGTCNNATGTCNCNGHYVGSTCATCDVCWGNIGCIQANKCGGVGTCIPSYGCDCNVGYAPSPDKKTCVLCDACHYGKDCTILQTCSGHGACHLPAGCACTNGWAGEVCNQCDSCHSGANCEVECSGNGRCYGLDNNGCFCNDGYSGNLCQESKGGSGGVVAGVVVSILVVGAAGGLFLWKRRNPGKPFSALLPEAIRPGAPASASSLSKVNQPSQGLWASFRNVFTGSDTAAIPVVTSSSGTGGARAGGYGAVSGDSERTSLTAAAASSSSASSYTSL